MAQIHLENFKRFEKERNTVLAEYRLHIQFLKCMAKNIFKLTAMEIVIEKCLEKSVSPFSWTEKQPSIL